MDTPRGRNIRKRLILSGIVTFSGRWAKLGRRNSSKKINTFRHRNIFRQMETLSGIGTF
jgi:hypothetical protein